MRRSFPALAPLLFFAAIFLLGLTFDQLGFKFFSLVVVVLATGFMMFLPTKASLMVALVFISFQGFFKVVSNYHPIVHVGADIVVITLVLKVLYQRAFGAVQKTTIPPLSILFAIHFAWIFIVYFNPYSLGVAASLAGSKIYVSMFLLYFFGYYLVKTLKDVHQFFTLFVVLCIIHTIFAVIQGFLGPSSVVSIHPRYSVQLAKYMSTAFRPFGLTQLPGGPSIYIYTSLPFIAYYIYWGHSHLTRLLLLVTIPFAGLALMFCQVRSAIVKGAFSLALFVLGLMTSLKMATATRIKMIMGAAMLFFLVVVSVAKFMEISTDSYSDNERAFERSLSSFDVNAMSHARRNAMERFITYIKEVPMGAGFSRVGASAGAFKDQTAADKHFPSKFFFADNLWITLLIETGIPGMVIVSMLVLAVFYRGTRSWMEETRQNLIAPQVAILSALAAIAIGFYGGEGLIYNPESCFFWLFAGILIKIQEPTFNTTE